MNFLQIIFSLVLGVLSFSAVYLTYRTVNKKIDLFNANNNDTEEKEDVLNPYVFPEHSLTKNKKGCIITGIIFAILSAITFFVIYNNTLPVEFGQLAIVFILLISAAVFDYELRIIPNWLSLIVAVTGLASFGITTFIDYNSTGFFKETILNFIVYNVLGSILLLVVLRIMSSLTKNGFGGGDIKLLTAMSINFGIMPLTRILIAALFFSLIVSLIYLAIKKQKKNISLPFAPFIFSGFEFILLVNNFLY